MQAFLAQLLQAGERLIIRHEAEEIALTREAPLAVRPVSRL